MISFLYNSRYYSSSFYRHLIYTLTIFYINISFIVFESFAVGGGLTKTRTTLENLRDELMSVIPIAAVITLIILAISYAAKIVEKETFMRWAIGVIIVGSATQITNMLI